MPILGEREHGDHAAHNDGGDELRRIGHCLNHFPIPLMAKSVEREREEDGQRQLDGQRIDA